MKRPFRLFPIIVLLFALMVAPAVAQTAPAPAQPATGPVYVVTYIEVGAAAAGKATGLLRRYAGLVRRADGIVGFTLLREHGRPGRFATVEGWRDRAAFERHADAAKALADQLRPFLAAPPDPRVSSPLDVAPASEDPGGDRSVVYVLTHVDVVPTAKDQAIGLVKDLAAASRKDQGNLLYDVLQQDSRPNHMTLFEAWRDKGLRDNAVVSDHTKEFRSRLAPIAGALYDERLYDAVP